MFTRQQNVVRVALKFTHTAGLIQSSESTLTKLETKKSSLQLCFKYLLAYK